MLMEQPKFFFVTFFVFKDSFYAGNYFLSQLDDRYVTVAKKTTQKFRTSVLEMVFTVV
jgi:hypothetical protein